MADEYHDCGQPLSESESDISFQSECSRRAFLKTLVGAASMAGAVTYVASPNGVTILNAAAVTSPDELAHLDLHQAATMVRQKKVSPVQLTEACLSQIEALNPILN